MGVRHTGAASPQITNLIAATQRQVANIERWRETGEAASPEESREIYEGMKNALAAIAEGKL